MNIQCFIEFQYLFTHLLFEVGVHRSISLEIKAATVLGQLPVSCMVAGQVLRQHLCKFSAFARIWSGFTWLPVYPSAPFSTLSICATNPHPQQHFFLHSRCIPPVIMDDRHSSSAGTLAQVDQVSHLSGDCAACAYLWLSAARMEDSSASPACCHVGQPLRHTLIDWAEKKKLLMRDVR